MRNLIEVVQAVIVPMGYGRSIVKACALLFVLAQGGVRAEFVEPTFAADRSPKLAMELKPLNWAECALMQDQGGALDLGMSRAGYQCPKAKVLMGQGLQVSGVKRHSKVLQLVLDGQAPLKFKFDEKWLAPFLDTVHSADLNADGKPDFVLEFSFHGNGLAAVRTQLVFLVSDAKGYRFSHFNDITSPALSQFGRAHPAASSVVAGTGTQGGSDAASKFILGRFASDLSPGQSSQRYGKLKTRDGKIHVFFVFDLLGFQANESLPKLMTQADFPRWVLFQDRPGASETTLISAAEKSKHWSSPVKSLRSGYLLP
jgi:hypothetical protein